MVCSLFFLTLLFCEARRGLLCLSRASALRRAREEAAAAGQMCGRSPTLRWAPQRAHLALLAHTRTASAALARQRGPDIDINFRVAPASCSCGSAPPPADHRSGSPSRVRSRLGGKKGSGAANFVFQFVGAEAMQACVACFAASKGATRQLKLSGSGEEPRVPGARPNCCACVGAGASSTNKRPRGAPKRQKGALDCSSCELRARMRWPARGTRLGPLEILIGARHSSLARRRRQRKSRVAH